MSRRVSSGSRFAALVLLLLTGEAPPAFSAPAGVVYGYDPERGAFVGTADGRWELNPYAMVQLTHATAGHGSVVDTNGFNLHAAKVILHGHIFDSSLTYHFQINAGEGRVVAEDLYLYWRALPWLSLQVGQSEVTFNRQHITLEAYQELIDRSIVDARFNLQRDIGAIAWLFDGKKRYEATLGLWNGSRQDAPNDDTGYLGTLRLAYNPLGPIAFREADLDDSFTPKASFAVAGAYNPERIVAAQSPSTSATTLHHVTQGVAEATLRYRGISLTNELHVRRQAVGDAAHTWSSGGFTQVGHFLVPRHLEIVSRVARVAGSLNADDAVGEETLGGSYYFLGHRFKVQADASHLATRALRQGWRARMQLQFFL